MQDDLKSGLVVRVTGREIWVNVEGAVVPCLLRGRFRQRRREFQLAGGDRVRVLLPGRAGEAGAIEAVDDRASWLSRYNERDGSERPIVANLAALFVVAAVEAPPLRPAFIDRVLVSAEHGRVRATVVVNKVDLARADGGSALGAVESMYAACGYPVLRVSARTGQGVDELAAAIGRGVYAFVGESGVGKSSLLMRLDPNLDLRVDEVGERSGRGRHTTTFSQLYPLRDGYLADTPGVQTFGFPGSDKLALPACFPEIARHEDCRFQPCTHSHEPQCGVKEAVEAGRIHRSRYASYLQLLAEIDERAQRRARKPRQ